jgi:hypothetical protein
MHRILCNNNINSVKINVIPVTIRATGNVSNSFIKYLSNIPGKHDNKAVQKTTTIGRAHIPRRVLK